MKLTALPCGDEKWKHLGVTGNSELCTHSPMQVRCIQACQRHGYILQTVSHAVSRAGDSVEVAIYERVWSIWGICYACDWVRRVAVWAFCKREPTVRVRSCMGKDLTSLWGGCCAQFGIGIAEIRCSRRATWGAERVLGPKTLAQKRWREAFRRWSEEERGLARREDNIQFLWSTCQKAWLL